MSPAPGTSLGRYRLLAALGAGGMGEVWRAHDGKLDREVAIKLLGASALSDGASRERFRREAHVLASLSHPGVATIYDFDAMTMRPQRRPRMISQGGGDRVTID
jgi:serine/threonine protein kinase